MAKRSSLFGNTCLLGAASAFTKLLSFFTLPLFTAWLSPDAFGTVDILQTTALLLLPLVTLNAAEAVFRFLAAGEHAGEVLFGGLCLLSVGIGVLLLLLPLLARLSFLQGYLFYLLLFVAASAARSFAQHVLRARGRYTAVAAGQMLCALFTVLLQVYLIRFRALGAVGYLLGVVIGDVLTALFLSFFLWREKRGDRVTGSPALLGGMLRYALPLVPTAAIRWGSAALERFMLHRYCGVAAVGLFAAAAKIPSLLGFAAAVFFEAWQYTATEARAGERAPLFARNYRLLLPFGVLAAAGLALLGRPLFGFLFAPSYQAALSVLPYLVLAALFAALSQFLGSAYTAARHTGAALLTATVGVAVNLLSDLLLIPRYGLAGAAIASLAAYFTLFLVRFLHVGREMQLPAHAVRLSIAAFFFLCGAVLYLQAPLLSCLLFLLAPAAFADLLADGARFLWRRAGFFLFSLKNNNNM